MTGEAGAPGTAGDGFRVPVKEGRHRAPPTPPPPDRFIVPIAAAAALLTAASLIAIYATGIAPDATAAGRHGLAVSTAARSARTVHVPLTVLPVPVPTIGPSNVWDDPEDLAAQPSAPHEARQTFAGVSVPAEAAVPAEATLTTAAGLSGQGTAPTDDAPQSQMTSTGAGATRTTSTTPTTTSTSPASSTAAATPTSSATTTEEPTPVTTEPIATPETTDVLPDVVTDMEDAP